MINNLNLLSTGFSFDCLSFLGVFYCSFNGDSVSLKLMEVFGYLPREFLGGRFSLFIGICANLKI